MRVVITATLILFQRRKASLLGALILVKRSSVAIIASTSILIYLFV